MLSNPKAVPKMCDLTEEQLPARHKELLQAIGLNLKNTVDFYQSIAKEKVPFIKTFTEKGQNNLSFSLPPISVLFFAYENFLIKQKEEKQITYQGKYNRQDFINCFANLMRAGADPNAVCEFGLKPPTKNMIRPSYNFLNDRSPVYCAIEIEKYEREYDLACHDAKQVVNVPVSQPLYLWELFYSSPDIDVNALFYDDECECNVSLLAFLVGYNLNGEAFENAERYIKLLLKHPHLRLDPFCGNNVITKLVEQNKHDLIQCLLEHGASINRNQGLLGLYIIEDPLQEGEEELAKKFSDALQCLWTAPERINFSSLRENKTLLEYILDVGEPWHVLLQEIKMELAVQALQECRKSNKKDSDFVENIVKQLTGLVDKKNVGSLNIKILTENLKLCKAALNWANEVINLTFQTLKRSPLELVESVNESWMNQLGDKTPSNIKFLFQCYVNSGKATDNTIKKAIQTGQSLAVIHLLLSQVTIQDYNALFDFAMDLKNYQNATKRFAVIRLFLQTPHCKKVNGGESDLRVNYYRLMESVSHYCSQLEIEDPTYRILMRWFSSNCSPLLAEIDEKYQPNKKNHKSIEYMDDWKEFATKYLNENFFKTDRSEFDYSWKILLNHLWKLKIGLNFKSTSNFKTLPSAELEGLRYVDYWRMADYLYELAENYMDEDKQAIDKSLALNQPRVIYPVAHQLCEEKGLDYARVHNRLMRAQSIINRKRIEFPKIKETGLQFIKMARMNKTCAKVSSKLGQPEESKHFYSQAILELENCIAYGKHFANQKEIRVLKKLCSIREIQPKILVKSAASEKKDPIESKPNVVDATPAKSETDQPVKDISTRARRRQFKKPEKKEVAIEQPNYALLLTSIVTTLQNKFKQIEDKSSEGYRERFERSLATIKKSGNGKIFNKWFHADMKETEYCKNVKSLLWVDEEFHADLAEYKNLLAVDNQVPAVLQAAVEKETIPQWNRKREEYMDSVFLSKYNYRIFPLIKEYSHESSPLLERLDLRLGQLISYQTMLDEEAALVLRIKPKISEPIQNIPRLLGKKALKAREDKEAAKQKKLAEQEAARIKSAEFKAAKAKLKQEKATAPQMNKALEGKAQPVPEAKQKKQQGFRDNIWLDHALRHLLAIKHILASEIEDKDAKRYSLVYNIFRCFQALLIYQAKGNDLTPQLNQDIIINLRNMIRHRGAYLSTYDEVIKTAMELDQLLSKDMLELRKPYLMDSALTQEQVNKLVNACKLTNNPLFEISPFWISVNSTDLYKILACYHAGIKNNKTSPIDNDLQIAALVPIIISIYRQIQKNYQAPPLPKERDAFNFTHMPNVHALKMLFAICGDMCQKDHCQRELKNTNNSYELKAFYQFQQECWVDSNKIAHEFHNEGGDISIKRVFDLCMVAEKLNLEMIKNKLNSKLNFKKILNKGFTTFEFSGPANIDQSQNPNRGYRM